MIERISGITHLRKNKGRKLKILIVRPDRIGDVVLSTPVLEALRRAYPGCELHMFVRDNVLPIVRHNPFIERVIAYRPYSVHYGILGLYRMWRAIRRENYDVVITLQANFLISLAVLFSMVPYRIGPYSKWYSILFFNRGMRQNRSQVAMHETDYNLMLLRKLGIRAATRTYVPHITVDADAKNRVREMIRSYGIEDGTKFVIVHPGMGGSALNWPEGYYIDLVTRLALKGITLFVTGSADETLLVKKVISDAKENAHQKRIYSFISDLSDTGLSEYIALMSLSSLVIAPSTGPLHIATALGKHTVSFYSPIRVQSAIRWGPYEGNEEKHSVLVPDALCGQDFKCAGSKCPFYFCMERVSVDEAISAVLFQLENIKCNSM